MKRKTEQIFSYLRNHPDATNGSIAKDLDFEKDFVAKQISLFKARSWIRSSTLSLTTRDSHRALDGQTKASQEKFKSPVSGYTALQPHIFGVASEDVNCRCRTYSRIKSIHPEFRRDSETKKNVKFKNYEDWLEKR